LIVTPQFGKRLDPTFTSQAQQHSFRRAMHWKRVSRQTVPFTARVKIQTAGGGG